MSVLSGCGEEIKVWAQKDDKGNIEEEYEYYNHPENNKRIKQGYFNSYHTNGEYKEVGTYKEDVRDGKWVEYYESGNIKKEVNYKDGKEDGKMVWYDEEGNITSEKTFQNGECIKGCD